MDKVALGRRLAQTRELAGMTQDSLARAVGLDRAAVASLEKGERKLSAPELVEIAKAVGQPLAYFVAPAIPALVSRRSDATTHHSTPTFDAYTPFNDELDELVNSTPERAAAVAAIRAEMDDVDGAHRMNLAESAES